MGCIASMCASCCGSCAGSCCAGAVCGKCCPKSTQTRTPYLIVMFLGALLALIMRYWGGGWTIKLFWFWNIDICQSDVCVGQEAVYRISAGLCVFFAIHALCMLSAGTRSFHSQFWCLKLVLLPVLIIVFFLIPNSPFDVYAIIARFVSGVFLLLQLVILIDFGYAWNAKWTDDDNGANPEKARLKTAAAVVFVLYGASIVVAVFLFRLFASNADDCKLEQFFVGFTITITSIVTIISGTSWCKHGSLLPSGVVTLYCFYLCYSALTSDPSTCNSLQSQTTAQIIIGIGIAGCTVCYAAWNLSNSRTIFGIDDEEVAEHEEMHDASSSSSNNAAAGAASGDEENPKADKVVGSPAASEEANTGPETEAQMEKRKRDLKFHIVMAACSMYLAMLLTSWGNGVSKTDPHDPNSSTTAYDLSTTAMWIKIVTQWVCILLYTLTLILPPLFRDRDFGWGSMYEGSD